MAQMPDEKITVSADANVQGRDSETGQVQKIPVGLSAEDLEHALALQRYVPGTAAEKRLVRKLDFILLPVLWLMYVLAYLDRGNIANANAAGLSEDLGLSDNQYSLFISTFFVGYFIFEVPSNLMMARFPPSIYLSSIVLVWGAVVAGMSASKNASSFLAGRFFLGCIEAGLFPGALYLLTCWYKKDEVGKRFCIFYTSGAIAPALGGIMAGAVIGGLDGARGWEGWRWLLLIEGVITVACALCLYFLLVDYPLTTKRFSPEERQLAYIRILHDRKTNVSQDTGKLTGWQAVKAVVADVRTWFFLVLYVLDSSSTTISYFIPTILKQMGYTSVTAQWMTVPIWSVAAVFMLFFSWTSDKTQDRRWHNTGLLSVPFIACIICMTVQGGVVRYVMMCFFVAGLYTAVPLILNWASETLALPDKKRSVALAWINSVGNLSIIYGSYLWPSKDSPKYTKGFASVAAFTGVGVILAALIPILFSFKFIVPDQPRTKAERDLLAREAELTVELTAESPEQSQV